MVVGPQIRPLKGRRTVPADLPFPSSPLGMTVWYHFPSPGNYDPTYLVRGLQVPEYAELPRLLILGQVSLGYWFQESERGGGGVVLRG